MDLLESVVGGGDGALEGVLFVAQIGLQVGQVGNLLWITNDKVLELSGCPPIDLVPLGEP